jgi:nucleotide-binding universal stress UspA family protein
MARPILHPTDFSTASRPAFRKAIDLAAKLEAPLLIVHVVSPPAVLMGEAYVPPQVYVDMERALKIDAQKRLDRVVAAAKAKGARASGLLLEGSAHEEIVSAAKSKHAEMIAMGTHGRTGIKGLLLGSVTWRVLTSAPCPVLAIRAQ